VSQLYKIARECFRNTPQNVSESGGIRVERLVRIRDDYPSKTRLSGCVHFNFLDSHGPGTRILFRHWYAQAFCTYSPLKYPQGGLHRALQCSSVPGSVACAFDWDQLACQVYSANHPTTTIERTDISRLTAETLSALHADLWLLSPSCQPYTVLNPQAKGALDPRAASFLHLFITVLPDLVRSGSHPSHLLVENVAGFEVLLIHSLFATDSKYMRRPQAHVNLSYQL
jgi:hypothetical protein